MTTDQLRQLFERSHSIEPDDEVRARAREAALDAFDASEVTARQDSDESAKDSGAVVRPMVNPNKRSQTMEVTAQGFNVQRWVASGLASAAVMMLAVVFILQMPTTNVPDESAPFLDPGVVNSTSRPPVDQSGLASSAEEVASADTMMKAPMPVPREIASSRQASPEVQYRLAPSSPMADRAASSPPAFMIEQPMTQNRDTFPDIEESDVKLVREAPVSTFSIDVDTASYSFVRKQLEQGRLPAADAVRLEEMVNYFPYDYPTPATRDVPFEPTVTVLDSPWREGNRIVHIGIRGYEAPVDADIRSNIVFLLDVSGSMRSPDKLPLLKQSMKLLLDQLGENDTVSIVVYAGAAGQVLEPTRVAEREKIVRAFDQLSAGGSTAGAAGIQLAYQTALSAFVEDGVNRVILATDGDFNVGISDPDELTAFIETQRDQGVFLSVLGFGQGNYQDRTMQALAQNGNGIAAYIDGLGEAQKVLVNQATSTLFTIAKDVKIQVEFNPATVKEYRLLGYETRALNREDFNNDAVDAGEIGAGHTVTALYEITPVGQTGLVDPLRYGNEETTGNASAEGSEEYGFLKMRYKLPDEDSSQLITRPIPVDREPQTTTHRQEAEFAIAVAGFAQLLRDSDYSGSFTYEDVIALAQPNRGEDEYGYRAEFVQLVRTAALLDSNQSR